MRVFFEVVEGSLIYKFGIHTFPCAVQKFWTNPGQTWVNWMANRDVAPHRRVHAPEHAPAPAPPRGDAALPRRPGPSGCLDGQDAPRLSPTSPCPIEFLGERTGPRFMRPHARAKPPVTSSAGQELHTSRSGRVPLLSFCDEALSAPTTLTAYKRCQHFLLARLSVRRPPLALPTPSYPLARLPRPLDHPRTSSRTY
jgi:hypothetical protein